MSYSFFLPDYPVLLGSLQETLPPWLHKRRYSQIFLLADENTRAHCLPAFLQKSGLPLHTPGLTISPGENHKTLVTCEQIWQAMFEARLDRQALVIDLGGGVIGDMGGFCAATYKRGVDFIQIPTTLLAMTDASIGGKLGIDFRGIKNAVGVFRNPAAVFVDPAFLHTLPARELRSGFAEVIKHALVGDAVLWEKIRAVPMDGLAPDSTGWRDMLRASIAVKVRIVTEDPLEKGLRALLNFGHTIGHAIESYFLQTDHPLTHGEAVAIGMICEASPAPPPTSPAPPPTPPAPPPTPPQGGRGAATSSFPAEDLSPTPPLPPWGGVGGGAGGVGGGVSRTAEEVSSVILRHFGHRPVPEAAFPALWELMLQDKKNASGAVQMAVPDAEPYSMRRLELSRESAEQRLRIYNAFVSG